MQHARLMPWALGLTFLAGCTDPFKQDTSTPRVTAIYSPSTGAIPLPNDLLYQGSMDATLNAPVADPLDYSDPIVQLNALDGWSTVAPFIIEFGGAIDIATVIPGDTLRIFEVTTFVDPTQPVGTPVTGVTAEVTAYSVGLAPEDLTDSTLRVFLEEPLQSATTYMVVLTDGIQDEATGRGIAQPNEYILASADNTLPDDHPFRSLQVLVTAMEAAAETQLVLADDIALAYTFTTQGISDALSVVALIAAGQEAVVISNVCSALPGGCADQTVSPFSAASISMDEPSLGPLSAFVPIGMADNAAVYTGGLTLPYYLTAASNSSATGAVSDGGPLTGFWRSRYGFIPGDTEQNLSRFNPIPDALSQENVPVLLAIPNTGAAPAAGWPVAIFQHGIGQNRSNALAMAESMAAAGIATIGIDLPLHGLDSSSGLFAGYLDGTRRERTFGLDFFDNATLAFTPDGVPDASGAHFINLQGLLTSRDNVRQGVADLLNLTAVLGQIDVRNNGTGADGNDGTPDFDLASIHFIGHSLGGIVGTPFLALAPSVTSATLGMAGGGIPKLLAGSASFSPIINGGLASVGILPDTPEYEQFFWLAQTATDSSDAINYGESLGDSGKPVHFIEVVGGGVNMSPADQTVPNSVADAPLSGSEPLIAALGLTSIDGSVPGASAVSQGVVRFIEGTHGSLISPGATAEELAAFLEMQTQTALFHASGGTMITVTDDAVVQ